MRIHMDCEVGVATSIIKNIMMISNTVRVQVDCKSYTACVALCLGLFRSLLVIYTLGCI